MLLLALIRDVSLQWETMKNYVSLQWQRMQRLIATQNVENKLRLSV